jgi:hypothetical protein
VTGSDGQATELLGNDGILSEASAPAVTGADFVDWPITIGLDTPLLAPLAASEPHTITIFLFGLIGLAGLVFRKTATSSGQD